MDNVVSTVYSKSENLAAARKAEEAAMNEANKIVGEQTKAEKEVVTAARKEYDDARQLKLTADPAAAALRKEIDETQKAAKELMAKIHEAEKTK